MQGSPLLHLSECDLVVESETHRIGAPEILSCELVLYSWVQHQILKKSKQLHQMIEKVHIFKLVT